MRGGAHLLLVSGSLRHGSTNTAVLRTAMTLAPDGVVTTLFDGLAALPAFNPDDEVEPLPAPAANLRRQIHDADAVLFSVPEYAGGLPGSFKNLLDWLIGDDHPGSIYEKPVGWLNASPRGAVHAYESLRLVLSYAHARIVDDACVHVPVTSSSVDSDGLISDPAVSDHIARALKALVAES